MKKRTKKVKLIDHFIFQDQQNNGAGQFILCSANKPIYLMQYPDIAPAAQREKKLELTWASLRLELLFELVDVLCDF